MKIVRLTAENVKRLRAVEIRPDGHLITIGGRNEAGKTSVLDSIAYALGGQKLIPAQPVRKGQTKAQVSVELEDLVITRTFDASGSSVLVVASKAGARYPSPQAMLDRLVGRLTFDPFAFTRLDEREQAETLRRLVGCETSDLDTRRREAFDERTVVNRDVKLLEGQLAGVPRHEDAPPGEIPIASVSDELRRAQDLDKLADEAERTAEAAEAALQRLVDARIQADRDIEALRAKLLAVEVHRGHLVDDIAQQDHAVSVSREASAAAREAVPDLNAIRQRFVDADAANQVVRANRRHAEIAQQLAARREATATLTSAIDEIDTAKATRLQALTFPVAGLGLDDAGVTFDGLPFSQASSAVQLRVSVAIGLALNPKVKVLLVRDGSLLDSTSLQLLAEMAAAADGQVWVERVAESKDGVSVFIEDGAIAGAQEPPPAEPVATAASKSALFDGAAFEDTPANHAPRRRR